MIIFNKNNNHPLQKPCAKAPFFSQSVEIKDRPDTPQHATTANFLNRATELAMSHQIDFKACERKQATIPTTPFSSHASQASQD